MNSDEVLLLCPREVKELLTLDECIKAVEFAFRVHGENSAKDPATLSMHSANGGFHIKAGMLTLGRSYFATKVNGNFSQNRSLYGLPTIQGIVILCDASNGSPLAVMDSRDITSLRTAAATAVATKYLARPESRTVTICGCGEQGLVQLRAVVRICPAELVFAFDQDKEQATRLSLAASKHGIPVEPVNDLAAAVRKSDICVTCTTSREPLLYSKDVSPGTFVAAVGADHPEKQELHPSLMKRSTIVCDVLEQCALMGDLHHALGTGLVTRADVHAELGEIVAGRKMGRQSAKEVTIFDSTGMALQDVAVAAVLYEKATMQGSGLRLSFAA